MHNYSITASTDESSISANTILPYAITASTDESSPSSDNTGAVVGGVVALVVVVVIAVTSCSDGDLPSAPLQERREDVSLFVWFACIVVRSNIYSTLQ